MADKTLPSITVTDAQYQRLAKIIPGDTAAEKASAYKGMVKAMLRGCLISPLPTFVTFSHWSVLPATLVMTVAPRSLSLGSSSTR